MADKDKLDSRCDCLNVISDAMPRRKYSREVEFGKTYGFYDILILYFNGICAVLFYLNNFVHNNFLL
jgi:hypothetical protein